MAETKKFLIKGKLLKRNETVPFSREVSANSEKSAKDKTKALFGSNYRLKRNRIVISSVEEVK